MNPNPQAPIPAPNPFANLEVKASGADPLPQGVYFTHFKGVEPECHEVKVQVLAVEALRGGHGGVGSCTGTSWPVVSCTVARSAAASTSSPPRTIGIVPFGSRNRPTAQRCWSWRAVKSTRGRSTM